MGLAGLQRGGDTAVSTCDDLDFGRYEKTRVAVAVVGGDGEHTECCSVCLNFKWNDNQDAGERGALPQFPETNALAKQGV